MNRAVTNLVSEAAELLDDAVQQADRGWLMNTPNGKSLRVLKRRSDRLAEEMQGDTLDGEE